MFKKFKELSNKVAQQEWQQVLNQKDSSAPVAGDQPPLRTLINRTTIAGVVLIEQGVIQDVFPFLRLYKVALSGGPIIVCTYAADTTSSNFGVQDHTTLTVGTVVWVLRIPGSPYGSIIAIQPEFLTVPGMRHADELVSGSNVGYIGDPFYRTVLLRKSPRGGMPYWEGSHLDSIPGEWVKMAHTGVAIFADPFLAGIKANEYCGVWVNYFDSLLRIAGLNYQKWTGGSEENEYIDWDKYISYTGYAYTLSGQAGMKNARGSQFQELSANYHENPALRASAIEPKSAIFGEDAYHSRFPVHNKQVWGGIIGQGGLEFVVSSHGPPEQSPVPVSKIQIANTASGFHIVQAEGGILLAKYPLIPSVVKIADFDEELYDPNGTCVARASNIIDKFLRGSSIIYQTNFLAASKNIHDIRNYLCNWEALAGVYAYINKFKILGEKNVREIKRISVNEKSRFGSGAAYIYLDTAGDIVLENRSGARIELIGNDIRISAPGRIVIDSGKDVTIFAKKVDVLGKQGVSLSTEKRGINIKQNELKILTDFIYGKAGQIDECRYDLEGEIVLESSAQTYIDVPLQSWIYYHKCEPSGYAASSSDYKGPRTLLKSAGYCIDPVALPDIKLEDSDRLFAGADINELEQQGEQNKWRENLKEGQLYFLDED